MWHFAQVPAPANTVLPLAGLPVRLTSSATGGSFSPPLAFGIGSTSAADCRISPQGHDAIATAATCGKTPESSPAFAIATRSFAPCWERASPRTAEDFSSGTALASAMMPLSSALDLTEPRMPRALSRRLAAAGSALPSTAFTRSSPPLSTAAPAAAAANCSLVPSAAASVTSSLCRSLRANRCTISTNCCVPAT